MTIPDWVPGVGGTTLGFNIPTIPQLAEGGIATSVSDGAQIATLPIGYRPRDYILVPAVIQDSGARYAVAVQITVSGTIIYNGPSNTAHPFRIFINSSYFVD